MNWHKLNIHGDNLVRNYNFTLNQEAGKYQFCFLKLLINLLNVCGLYQNTDNYLIIEYNFFSLFLKSTLFFS